MKKFCLAVALLLGASFPAWALTDRDTVVITGSPDTAANWYGFSGPVNRIGFLSPDHDVDCDAITVQYLDDGTSQNVFSGTLFAGKPQSVNFGKARPVRDIRLFCHVDNVGRASLDLTANVMAKDKT